nr:hypothetical protein [Methanobacterium formicicum]
MGYYDMNKDDRRKLVLQMEDEIKQDLQNSQKRDILHYSADDDVYIRKKCFRHYGADLSKGPL